MTLNEVYFKVLKPMFEDHPMIGGVGFGDLEKYGLSEEVKFPFAFAATPRLRRIRGGFAYSIPIIFADIVNHDESNVIDIQSDMINVAADIAGKLIDHAQVDAGEDFTLTPFVQRFHDLTAGVVMDIVINVPASIAGCENCD